MLALSVLSLQGPFPTPPPYVRPCVRDIVGSMSLITCHETAFANRYYHLSLCIATEFEVIARRLVSTRFPATCSVNPPQQDSWLMLVSTPSSGRPVPILLPNWTIEAFQIIFDVRKLQLDRLSTYFCAIEHVDWCTDFS